MPSPTGVVTQPSCAMRLAMGNLAAQQRAQGMPGRRRKETKGILVPHTKQSHDNHLRSCTRLGQPFQQRPRQIVRLTILLTHIVPVSCKPRQSMHVRTMVLDPHKPSFCSSRRSHACRMQADAFASHVLQLTCMPSPFLLCSCLLPPRQAAYHTAIAAHGRCADKCRAQRRCCLAIDTCLSRTVMRRGR